MNRKITVCNSINEHNNVANNMKKIVLRPKESTLDFIRQFARVYCFEPKLGSQLGSFIIN
ncbi:MAG: hypothetical protein LBE56_09575 [Tannerella sp.]|nr:hypothetical protein [Tannerella sp.]